MIVGSLQFTQNHFDLNFGVDSSEARSFLIKLWNVSFARVFVRRLATFSSVITLVILISPAITLSLAIYWSISTCFILACRIGFFTICVVAELSIVIVGVSIMKHNSVSIILIKTTSHVVFANTLYLASTDDLEMVVCLFDFHEICDFP